MDQNVGKVNLDCIEFDLDWFKERDYIDFDIPLLSGETQYDYSTWIPRMLSTPTMRCEAGWKRGMILIHFIIIHISIVAGLPSFRKIVKRASKRIPRLRKRLASGSSVSLVVRCLACFLSISHVHPTPSLILQMFLFSIYSIGGYLPYSYSSTLLDFLSSYIKPPTISESIQTFHFYRRRPTLLEKDIYLEILLEFENVDAIYIEASAFCCQWQFHHSLLPPLSIREIIIHLLVFRRCPPVTIVQTYLGSLDSEAKSLVHVGNAAICFFSLP